MENRWEEKSVESGSENELKKEGQRKEKLRK